VQENVKYWFDLSDYDMDTAIAMLETQRYLYVGFMCHQAVEKILKAYYVQRINEIAPYTHGLMHLVKISDLENDLLENHEILINQLEPLNIEARYPSYKEKLLADLTESKCRELITSTKEFITWIKKQL
jgi:HEPN domain-containing protein